MNDRIAIEFVHSSHDAVLELLFGCDADVAQDRASELGEEALDEVEPGAVLGREGEFENGRPAAWRAKPLSPRKCARNDCRGSA